MYHWRQHHAMGGAFLLVLLATTIAFSQTYYWGNNAQNCGTCHSAVVQTWSQTAHARAYDSLKAIASFGYSCQSCHNTGWDAAAVNYGADEYVTQGADDAYTITDQTNFDRVKNIQCETCHGPLGKDNRTFLGFTEHRAAAVKTFAAENCGSCHEGSHHPTFSNWQTSKHAVSKFTSIPGGSFNFIASDPNCAGCHTAEGFVQFIEQEGWEPNVEAPGEAGHDLTCAGCHNPHSTEFAGQLRMPKELLCAKCHNPEYNPDVVAEPTVDSEVHHSTAFMFEGKGGYHYAGFEYPSSAHKFAVTEKCVTCHVFKTDFQAGPPEVPAYTGHAFTPHLESCVPCHSDFNPADNSFDYRGTQTAVLALLEDLFNRLDAASVEDSVTAAFLRARFNYEFVETEGSFGIHNTKYATALLQSSIANFTPSAVKESTETKPAAFALAQNYPNPFNPTTVIEFDVPSSGNVAIHVYDVRGALVATLANQFYQTGRYKVMWDGRDANGMRVSAGTYFYRLETDANTLSRKMVFLK